MSDDPPAKRMRLGGDGLVELSKEELINEHKKQESYIAALLAKLDGNACTSGGQGDLEERLKQQQAEAGRKEKVLLMQLTRKEQELQELATQLGEITKGNTQGASQLRSALLEPALNILFQRMRNQLDEKSKKLQQATDDMAAWKFTPDSQTGKRLMSKCRTLILENQELGKQVSTGRTAQLEAELALQKKYSEELKASQDELNEFVIQLDEEVEGMQSTICALQQQLKDAKDELTAVRANAKQTEARVPEETAQNRPTPEPKMEAMVLELDDRTLSGYQEQQPESPLSEPPEAGPAATPSSPAPLSPEGRATGNRTPSEETEAASAAGEGQDQRLLSRTAESGISPGPEDKGVGYQRTAGEASVSPRDEEQRTTLEEVAAEKERTTKMSAEEERTIISGEAETPEHRQPEVEMETSDQVTRDGEEALPEQQEWDMDQRQDNNQWQLQEDQQLQQEQQQKLQWEQRLQQEQQQELKQQLQQEEHMQHEQQQPQQQELQKQQWQQQQEDEEKMEIDPSRFESDSSTESESYLQDVQQTKPSGELTSPQASGEAPKPQPGDDSDEGFSTSTPDQGPVDLSTRPQGLDQTVDPYQSTSGPKFPFDPSGNSYDSDAGVVDSSSGQGTEGSPADTNEISPSVSRNQDNAIRSSQTEGVSNSTFTGQVTCSKAEPEAQTTQVTHFPEVKVTAKKLPHNCSLSVVDYDTGSSDEEDYIAGEAPPLNNRAPPPNNQTPPPNTQTAAPTTNHSPTNQSPESPGPASSPETSSPASPANNVGQTVGNVPPTKLAMSQMPTGDGDSNSGVPTKLTEPRDSAYIEENGTGCVHEHEQVTAGSSE